jgi:hypothetical protein
MGDGGRKRAPSEHRRSAPAEDAFEDVDDFDDERPSSTRPTTSPGRVVAGIACAVVGIIAAVLAVRAASDDDAGARTTTTTGIAVAGSEVSGGSSSVPPPGWPPATQGRPKELGTLGPPPTSAGGLAPGWYLWSDFRDWHLWLVGGEGVDSSAVVTTNDKLTLKNTYGDAAVAPTDTSATIRRGAGAAPIAGIDFNPGFYGNEITVTITGDLPLRTGQHVTEATTPLELKLQPAN